MSPTQTFSQLKIFDRSTFNGPVTVTHNTLPSTPAPEGESRTGNMGVKVSHTEKKMLQAWLQSVGFKSDSDFTRESMYFFIELFEIRAALLENRELVEELLSLGKEKLRKYEPVIRSMFNTLP